MTEDWFENVENLRPLRGGRRGETLNEVSSHTKFTAKDAEEKFRLALETTDQSSDPLSGLWDYVVWLEEHFPSGKQRLFYPILYKICTTFCVIPKYKNDERMLKLWLKLAESFPESGLAVMEFAFTKGSCRQLAKFYVQWSEMYQTMGCWNRAREKLHLGIKMCATPLPSLHAATDELEARVLRACVKVADQADSDDDDQMDISDLGGSQRKMLGKLRGLGRKHNAPIIRLAQGGPGKIVKVQTPAMQKSFDVFMDQCHSQKGEKAGKKTNTVANEFRDDPDYQALFGFFDDREKVTLHLTNEENLCKLSSKMVTTKTSVVSAVPAPDFEVYTDMVEEEQKKPMAAPLKARLKIKKSLAQMSVEEMYALRLYPNAVN